jgi:hypothetical protein
VKLGGEVPGIHTDAWLFVADDTHGIARQVREYDSDARLVAHAETQELAIARWVQESFCPGGAWVIVCKCFDPDTEQPLTGEPDSRVMTLLRRADTWRRRYPERYARAARRVLEGRERLRRAELAERNRELAERAVHRYRKNEGIKTKASVPRLWVPEGVTR